VARAKKSPPTRRPAKAKGTLPAPRVAPSRIRLPWHRRTDVRIVAGIVAAVLIAVGVWQFFQYRKRSEERRDVRRQVQQFDRALVLLVTPLSEALQPMNTVPDQVKSGEVSAADFKTQSDAWLASFRKLDQGIRKRQVPSRLEDAKNFMVGGSSLYIEAIKVLQIASLTGDATARNEAIDRGKALVQHANFVFRNGQRELQIQKRLVGLAEDSSRAFEQPVAPPEGEPASPSPAAGSPSPGASATPTPSPTG
jgi:hypothetical protein